MDILEILKKMERGEAVKCEVCENDQILFNFPNDPAPFAACPEGHISYGVSWTPYCHSDRPSEFGSLWLEGIDNLSFEQLKVLREVMQFYDKSLIEIKRSVCDGNRHYLFTNVEIAYIEEAATRLTQYNIPFFIEKSTTDPSSSS